LHLTDSRHREKSVACCEQRYTQITLHVCIAAVVVQRMPSNPLSCTNCTPVVNYRTRSYHTRRNAYAHSRFISETTE